MSVIGNPKDVYHMVYAPRTMIRDNKTSWGAKILYALLSSKLGDNGSVWPKQTTLAYEMNVTTRSIIFYLNELIDNGYIKKENKEKDNPKNNRNRYFLCLDAPSLLEAEDNELKGKQAFHDMKDLSLKHSEESFTCNMKNSSSLLTNKTKTNKEDINTLKSINKQPPVADTKNPRNITIKEVKAKKYSKDVLELFDDFNGVPDGRVHRKGTIVANNGLKELHKKLYIEHYEVEDILSVLGRYSACRKHPIVSQKIKRLDLCKLLNNIAYGGKFDWWKLFNDNTLPVIIDMYKNGKKTKVSFDQTKYDADPKLTAKVATAYAKNFLGSKIVDLATDYNYDKFRTAAMKIKIIVEANNKHPSFNNEDVVLKYLIKAIDSHYKNEKGMSNIITPGYLCSNNTWKVILPGYLKTQMVHGGVKWKIN